MYKRKTFDTWEVQTKTCQGWEDVYSADSWRDARDRVKEYRANQPEYAHRVICRRVRIEKLAN